MTTAPSPVAALKLPAAPLRFAAVQASAVPGDVAGNAERAAALIAHAARDGARVVMFPELHLCAYDLRTLADGSRRGEIQAGDGGTITDPRLDALATAAIDHAVTVLHGAAIRRPDGTLTNSAVVVHPDGTITVAYDKQHLWHDEHDVFTPGDRGEILPVGDWLLGLGICYDLSFPEHARAAALGGAHAYLCLGAFATGTEHRAGIYLAARALENTIYTVFANPVGGPPHRPCNGGTTICHPDGSTAHHEQANHEAVVRSTFDPAELQRIRGFLPMLQDARAHHAAAHAGSVGRSAVPRTARGAPTLVHWGDLPAPGQ